MNDYWREHEMSDTERLEGIRNWYRKDGYKTFFYKYGVCWRGEKGNLVVEVMIEEDRSFFTTIKPKEK